MAPPVNRNAADRPTSGLLKANTLPRRAYVTFLAGDGDYWKGVVALAKGLRKAKSVYPLVVAMLPDVPMDHRQKLLAQGCIIREIEPLYPPENQTQFAMAYYVINYSKLRIWEVTNLPVLFVSVYIYKPLPTEYNLILAMLWRHPENVDLDKIKVVHYCADGSKPWRFTGKEKNMDREDIKMLVDKWWDIYNDETLDYRRTGAGGLSPQLITAVETPTPALTKRGGRPRYVTAPSAA
ncbi:Glycosyl transferase, family 8 [Cynara cardunculus var. scolymus]|uniref:Hexosyltransferase n=1 Tax=Cynara cardunculus var. scolymus TaxID=59895 RepID=A0A103Y9N8_CYNCS|nr:Glycosyl transferase, family 8 [Cynara cardunculus var. scolymus]